jgi:hypothetical protein
MKMQKNPQNKKKTEFWQKKQHYIALKPLNGAQFKVMLE